MKRTNIHLSERQRERIQRLAEYTGLNAAELVRRAIDRYLDEEEAKHPASSEHTQSGK